MNKEVCATLDDLFDAFKDDIRKEDIIYAKSTALIVSSIVKERLKNNMTQTEFAQKLGIKQSMVSRWESGSSNFTIKTLSKIAATLDMDLYVNLTKHKDIKFTSTGKYHIASTCPQSRYDSKFENAANIFNANISYTQKTLNPWKEVVRC